MSLILRYRFDDTDLTIDSSSSGIPLVNTGGVVSSVDATFGNVASFDASNDSFFTSNTSLTQIQGASPRTISFWVNRNTKNNFNIVYSYGNTGSLGGGIRAAFHSSGVLGIAYGMVELLLNSTFNVGTWYNIAEVYDGTTLSYFVDGVLDNSVNVTMNSTTDPISIGQDVVGVVSNSFIYTGFLSDFRVYDSALTSTDLLDITNAGPNPSGLNTTMFTHVADITWDEVSGASSYTVTSTENAGQEITHGDTTNTYLEIFNLNPDSSYEFKVYSDLDMVTPAYTETDVALSLNSTNVDSLMVRLQNDLTILSNTSSDEIEPFLGSVLTTGEIVNTSLGKTVFVSDAGTVNIDETEERFLMPFDQGSGTGQSISVVLPDTTINTIGYDQNTNQITSGATNYSIGSTFVLGNQKITVKEI